MKATKKPKLKPSRYTLICFAIFILAVISRFVLLGEKPLHHDEGMLSYFAWRLAYFGEYTYTPQIHSPILFYVQAVLFLTLGVNDTVSKIGPAIFGVALVMIPLAFHKLLSKKTVLFISLGFLASPMFLYYSRFLVHTSMVSVFWLVFILTAYNYVKTQKSSTLYWSLAFLALAFGTSETTYILMAIFAVFLVVFILVLRRKSAAYFRNFWRIIKKNYLDFITGGLIFVLIWSVIYSVGLTNPESLHRSLPILSDGSTGLGFWLAQNPKKLGGQPWHYYLMLALIYETIFVFGSLGFLYKLVTSKITGFKLFVATWFLGSLSVYSWAGEKFPWLFLPSLLGMVVATGIYLGENLSGFNICKKILWLVLALFTLFSATRLVYFNPADTNELAVYVQTPPDFQDEINKIVSDCSKENDKDCVLLDQKISWPLSWSFRDFSTLVEANNYSIQDNTKYLIVGSESFSSMKFPENWLRKEIRIRDWWVPDKCRQVSCIPKFLNYYFFRKTWNAKGGYEVYIFSRENAAQQ